MAMSDIVEQRIDNIEKSAKDTRQYRGIKLKNGFTALLISDPNTDDSAVSLSLSVGSLSDPKDLPGLTHLFMHMFHCHTDDIKTYLEMNEGFFCKAYAKNDSTTYYCSIKAESLGLLLSSFAQFVHEPFFDDSKIEKVIDDIDAEHQFSWANNHYRLSQLKIHTADPNHPYSNLFATGSKKTLRDIPVSKNICVYTKVIEHHSNWFSSNLMYLAVLGKEDLDDLEEMVTSVFGDIIMKNINMPIWTEPIYKEEQLSTMTIVVPVEDIRMLTVEFLIPDQMINYQNLPSMILNRFFQCEGSASILTVLKDKEWCELINANSIREARGIELYEIVFYLKEKGLDHVNDIITLIFQYINIIKREELQKLFHQDSQNISTNCLFEKQTISPMDYVFELTSKMINYNLKDVLVGDSLMQTFRPDLIQDLLSYFEPDNMRVTVVSKRFMNQTNAIDQHYGTQYSITKIPEENLNVWKNILMHKVFEMPTTNGFIDNDTINCPQIIYESSLLRCWFKCIEYHLPDAYISINFTSPIVKRDPFHSVILRKFVYLFNTNLSEYQKNIKKSGVELSITKHKYGFRMKFKGCNHRLHTILKFTIEKLLIFRIDPIYFEESESCGIHNNMYDEDKPELDAIFYNAEILSNTPWHSVDLHKTVWGNRSIIENVGQFINDFLSHMFIEVLVYGNMDKNNVMKHVQLIEKQFLGVHDLMSHEMTRYRELKLENGESAFYHVNNENLTGSCVFMYFQCGVQSVFSNMVVTLFDAIVKNSCHMLFQLEEFGYTFKQFWSKRCGTINFGIIVKSSGCPAIQIHSKIEKYIDAIKDVFEQMSQEEFDREKYSHLYRLLKKPENLLEQANIYEYEIFKKHYSFDRAKTEMETLQLITKTDVIQFYYDKINWHGLKRRKFTIHVEPMSYSCVDDDELEENMYEDDDLYDDSEQIDNLFENMTEIIDPSEFKNSHQPYPLTKRQNCTPTTLCVLKPFCTKCNK